MLDNAASSNFITTACVKKLGLAKKKTYVSRSGLGESNVGSARGITRITFSSRFNKSKVFNMEALIVPKINDRLPVARVDKNMWPHLKNIQLADPGFHMPGAVDILIGAELYYSMIDGVKKMDSATAPIATHR